MLLGDFKQEIMRINNKVNIEIFGQGLRWQKVEILQDKVLIIGNNKRVTALTAIDPKDRLMSKVTDIALILDFKERFLRYLENELKIRAVVHLKDYDPETELSFSITIFKKNIEEILKEI